MEDIYVAILAGVRESLAETRNLNGAGFTQAKKEEMRNLLKTQLLENFRQEFIDANISKTDAKKFISYLVDMELARA